MPSSVKPIPKSLLNMARKNARELEQKKRNNLTKRLRQARRKAEEKEHVEKERLEKKRVEKEHVEKERLEKKRVEKEHVEKEFAKLQARLYALSPSLAKEYVLVEKSDFEGMNSKKTKKKNSSMFTRIKETFTGK